MTSRRQFVQQGSLGLFSLLMQQHAGSSNSDPDEFKGIVVNEEDGEAYQIRDGTAIVKIKISGKQGSESISFLSETFKPGDKIPVHKHLNEEEMIFIHKGSGIFTLDEKEYAVRSGTVALVPKGIWHGLENTGTENLEMRFAYTPSGFEGWFREIGTPLGQTYLPKTSEERKQSAKKWGMIYKT